jgi:hypothetical protein
VRLRLQLDGVDVWAAGRRAESWMAAMGEAKASASWAEWLADRPWRLVLGSRARLHD